MCLLVENIAALKNARNRFPGHLHIFMRDTWPDCHHAKKRFVKGKTYFVEIQERVKNFCIQGSVKAKIIEKNKQPFLKKFYRYDN